MQKEKTKRNIFIVLLIVTIMTVFSGLIAYAAFTYKDTHECTVVMPDDLKEIIENSTKSGGGN